MFRRFSATKLLLTLVAILTIPACRSRGSRLPRVGSIAPDFAIGNVTLQQFRGEVVVLNFWATWCPPCVQELPSLVEMQRQMKSKGITVIAVSVDVDEKAYRQFLADHHVNLFTVRDPGQKTSALYGTFKFPETYIIDRKGVLQRKFLGAVDWTDQQVLDFLSKI